MTVGHGVQESEVASMDYQGDTQATAPSSVHAIDMSHRSRLDVYSKNNGLIRLWLFLAQRERVEAQHCGRVTLVARRIFQGTALCLGSVCAGKCCSGMTSATGT